MFKKIIFIFHLVFVGFQTFAQYAPIVGEEGSTAIYADSSIFVSWASKCEINRGYYDIKLPDGGNVTVGKDSSALGKADGIDVLSLGDGGTAILEFSSPIRNGEGFDFAVFENGFNDAFLELALVEVSSDGVNFVRFPAHSLTGTDYQVGPWGALEAKKINNLAGKYRALYGTPFDLEELKNEANLDVENVTHVKIIDVVGTTDPLFATMDTTGNAINDPYPTPFESGGFDLDAVGVIHEQGNAVEKVNTPTISIFPNPSQGKLTVNSSQEIIAIEIYDINGKIVLYSKQNQLDLSSLNSGIYWVKTLTAHANHTQSICLIHE